jgi:serine/threonine protein kinase
MQGELKAWKKVGSHAYISDLHFAFQDKRHCYFVMDLLSGADLRYYIKKRILLTEKVSLMAASVVTVIDDY